MIMLVTWHIYFMLTKCGLGTICFWGIDIYTRNKVLSTTKVNIFFYIKNKNFQLDIYEALRCEAY